MVVSAPNLLRSARTRLFRRQLALVPFHINPTKQYKVRPSHVHEPDAQRAIHRGQSKQTLLSPHLSQGTAALDGAVNCEERHGRNSESIQDMGGQPVSVCAAGHEKERRRLLDSNICHRFGVLDLDQSARVTGRSNRCQSTSRCLQSAWAVHLYAWRLCLIKDTSRGCRSSK